MSDKRDAWWWFVAVWQQIGVEYAAEVRDDEMIRRERTRNAAYGIEPPWPVPESYLEQRHAAREAATCQAETTSIRPD